MHRGTDNEPEQRGADKQVTSVWYKYEYTKSKTGKWEEYINNLDFDE